MTPTTTYHVRGETVTLTGHLTTTPTGAAGYVQDDAADEIESAIGSLCAAKVHIRAGGDWRESVKEAIVLLETLLDNHPESETK